MYGKPETQISSLYMIEIKCILVIPLFLWVHTISDDTTVFVFFEASSTLSSVNHIEHAHMESLGLKMCG